MNTAELLQYDREHIWHPYTSTIDPLPVLSCKEGGRGIYRTRRRTQIDRRYVFRWCEVHGYNHPVLNAAIENKEMKCPM